MSTASKIIIVAITIGFIESRTVIDDIIDPLFNKNPNDINQQFRDAAKDGNETLIRELLQESIGKWKIQFKMSPLDGNN